MDTTVFYPSLDGLLDLDYELGPFLGALTREEVQAVADGAKGAYARAFVSEVGPEDGTLLVWFTNPGEGEPEVEDYDQAAERGLLGDLTYEVRSSTPQRAP